MVRAFMVGAVVGGAAVWLWGDRVREYVDVPIRAVRDGLIELVDAATASLSAWRDRLDSTGRPVSPGIDRPTSGRGRPASSGNVAASLE